MNDNDTTPDYEYEISDETNTLEYQIQKRRKEIEQELLAHSSSARTIHLANPEETPREVLLAPPENADFSAFPREVYKDKKIKRYKNVSREKREETENLAPPGDVGKSKAKSKASGEESNLHSPAITSSRGITGISAQQNKTVKGIKVSLTVQTEEDAQTGDVFVVTAELKRADRIRELKAYSGDSEEFADFYSQAKQQIKDLEKEDQKLVCIGRLHERGKRAAWVADMLVVGKLNEDGILTQIIFYSLTEEYTISMDKQMSQRQTELYCCSGLYGNLITSKNAPNIQTLKRKPYGSH